MSKNNMDADYLILGSGLSALTFGALAAKSGSKVVLLEAHDTSGGFAHTFVEKNENNEYHFNAQLHYVWDCGEGEPVYNVLKELGLEKEVEFLKYNEDGFDHMYIPGFSLKVPNNYELLQERLSQLFPNAKNSIHKFFNELQVILKLIKELHFPFKLLSIDTLRNISNIQNIKLLHYQKFTLQNMFDKFELPLEMQSLLASQWPDFLLPPNGLSFFCWLILFDGYMRGAYYPKKHFEHVVNSLCDVITSHNGEIIYNTKVEQFHLEKGEVIAITARNLKNPTELTRFKGTKIICNFDPKHAASLIGIEHFSPMLQKQLAYDYSYSNFVVYGAVKDIDLRNYGFGNWNVFHSDQTNINAAFYDMNVRCDYSNPAFAITTPSLVTEDPTGCPDGHQIFQLLTVANYSHFSHLKYRNAKDYVQFKTDIYKKIISVIEKKYVPNFQKHVCFKVIGTPTTNTSYCWAPQGNSYGANMTPKNMGLNKLGFYTSLKNFYFCNASAGYAGFAKSFSNGSKLFEELTQTSIS